MQIAKWCLDIGQFAIFNLQFSICNSQFAISNGAFSACAKRCLPPFVRSTLRAVPAKGACHLFPSQHSHALLRNQACKMLERPVVGSFRVVGKAATGKLPAAEVIADAVAADSLARARFVTTIAPLPILLFFAFHKCSYDHFLRVTVKPRLARSGRPDSIPIFTRPARLVNSGTRLSQSVAGWGDPATIERTLPSRCRSWYTPAESNMAWLMKKLAD